MAENLKHASNPLGPNADNGEVSDKVEETSLLSSEALVFENWLKIHLMLVLLK